MRILGIVEGDPQEPLTLSGVPGFLLDALDRRFAVVARLDYGLCGARRALQAAATFRPRRADWVARFHLTPRAHHALTATLSERLQTVQAEFDAVFQVHGWVGGQPRPYFLYVDQTRSQIEEGWPAWLPMSAPARARARELERGMYAGAHHIFVMGSPARESLVSEYAIDRGRITVAGGGLNFRKLVDPGRAPVREPEILFVGREFERKGGRVLLEAFSAVRRRVPGARLHIVGPRRRFTQPGVIAHGVVADRDRLAQLYARARVVCAPSLYEPWGFVFMEAMAHGAACVGTTVQSIPEILDHGRAGLLVPPGDAAALAETLVTLLGDDALAHRLVTAGRRRVERYDWDRVVEAMAPALLSAAGSDSPSEPSS